MTNNITLTQGGTTVTIANTKIDENWENAMILFDVPSTGARKVTRVVDLLRNRRRWQIGGLLHDSIGGDSAITKRNNLRTFEGTRIKDSPITFNYVGSDFNVAIEKMNITELPTDSEANDTTQDPRTTLSQNPQSYEFNCTLVEVDHV